ncbi:hypothetical protein [Fischerella sp. PCC 9605]|jgi:hypothetical protein|uniref:hypothetical protein n=1 Tax=Fischerella sp. PCC 9605 TaxID=1173024 RepID=UPI0004ADF341|nr:hypothetical protein [Fischerella sp. PCC 9605]
MQVTENINIAQFPLQPISLSNTSQAGNTIQTRPKLSMIWIKELHEGHQRLIAKWVVVD